MLVKMKEPVIKEIGKLKKKVSLGSDDTFPLVLKGGNDITSEPLARAIIKSLDTREVSSFRKVLCCTGK